MVRGSSAGPVQSGLPATVACHGAERARHGIFASSPAASSPTVLSVGANCESSSALGTPLTVTRPVTHGAVPRVGVRFVRDEKMALWGSASAISMGDSPKVPFFQDVLEFGTRRQLELFTIIGKIAIIQDVLEFGTHVQLYMFATVLYNTRRILQLYTACTVHTTGTGVSFSLIP